MRIHRYVSAVILGTIIITTIAHATNVSGNITTTTWTSANSPYVVTDSITVLTGETLTVEAGVVVQAEVTAQLVVLGSLSAQGNSIEPIVFHQVRLSFVDAGPSTVRYASISGVRIREGRFASGGGVLIDNSTVVFEHTIIHDNMIVLPRPDHGEWSNARGGGMAVFNGSFVTLNDCEVKENNVHADYTWGMTGPFTTPAGQGAGIYLDGGSTVHVNGSVISDNNVLGTGGAAVYAGGQFKAVGTVISGNHARSTFDNWGAPSREYALDGTAIFNGGEVVLTHCTIVGNTGSSRYEAGSTVLDARYYQRAYKTTVLTNCIVWNNDDAEVHSSVTASHSNIWTPGHQKFTGNGNIFADPLFVDPDNGDYRLQLDSPCIDAGDPVLLDPDGSRSDIGAIPFGEVEPGTIIEFEIPSGILSLSLHQNVPNPFNPLTHITFTLPDAGRASLVVYDVTGRHVRTLVDGYRASGDHSVVWDGTDDADRAVANGMYVYRLTLHGEPNQPAKVRRCLLVR
jgi:hypothetical protein